MMNFPQQQQPGPFPFLDEIESQVHPVIKYVLAAVFMVGGFFYGLEHDSRVPLVVFIGLGLIMGLLATSLLKHLSAFVIYAVLVVAAALGTFWLFSNEAALRRQHDGQQLRQTAPVRDEAHASHDALDQLLRAVKP